MKRKGLVGTIFATILVIILAVTLAASYFVLNRYVVIDWQLYPKHQDVLDLRSQELLPENYDTLAWRMPDTKILWNVPFQGGTVPQDAEELTISQLTEEDIPALAYLTNLKTIHAEACTDYPQLMAAAKAYPKLNVDYVVEVGQQKFPSDSETILLDALNEADISMLQYLPQLSAVDATHCRDFAALNQLRQTYPQLQVAVMSSIAGARIDPEATNLTLEGAEYDELSVGLAAMPNLKTLTIHTPQATGEQLLALREEYPDVAIHWDVEVFGKTYPEDTVELDISDTPIDSVELAKAIAEKFPQLTKLIVDSGTVSNDDMAAYRDEVRSKYKVVWTVVLSPKCKARTDETYFMPIKKGEWYFDEKNVYNLRYCEDMVCIDIGHATVKTIDFVTYMPHLKYLIIAWTFVPDLTPLSSCKELIYLEIDNNDYIKDLSPLVGCTALEDLNLMNIWCDLSPVLEMTWLKNLWIPYRSQADRDRAEAALPDTHVENRNVSNASGNGWRNLKNYYDMRDYLGMHYMN